MTEPEAILGFLELYGRDRAAGQEIDLWEYQARFPGHEGLIAQAFANLGDQGPESVKGAATSAGPTPEAGPGPRTSVGPYRLLHELGRGGQGVVYLAEDTRLHRRVALKVLHAARNADDETLRRFRREAEVASRLDHPGICTIFESGVDDGLPFIAMRYLEGETLLARIAAARVRPEEAASASMIRLDSGPGTDTENEPADPSTEDRRTSRVEVLRLAALFEKIARAFHAAHEAGVIHRDVKPGNILITPAGEPVILDFGLARVDDAAGGSLTRTGDLFGTPAYMSPEQLLAQRVPLDRRTDVYSLGVTLFECLTLRRPFEAPTHAGLLHAIQSKEPPDPSRLSPAIPRDLSVVVLTAIEKDRDRRYQSMEALAEDLRRVRAFEPISARPAGPAVRLRRWAQRNRAVAASLGFVFVTLAAALVIVLHALVAEREALTDARAEKERAVAAEARSQEQSDARLVQAEIEDAGELWPPWPERIPAMDAWLGRIPPLQERSRSHVAALDAMLLYPPATAPGPEGDAEWRRRAFPAFFEQRRLVLADLRELQARRYREDSGPRQDELDEEIAAHAAKLSRCDADARAQLRPSGDPETDRRAIVLAGLRGDLETLEGLEPEIERRRAEAAAADVRADSRASETWRRCLQDLRADGRFPGVDRAQRGMIPLSKNSATGLWEFWLTASGGNPWDAALNRVEMGSASGLVLVLLPGGRFTMGSPEGESGRNANEGSIGLELAPFFMSRFEVTQAQWERVMGANPSQYRPRFHRTIGPDHPVESVSWTEVREFARRLGIEVPTEARWEYACRAGTTAAWCFGAEPTDLEGRENLADRSFTGKGGGPSQFPWSDGWPTHAPVAAFPPNAFGLASLHGNVAEWCADGYVDRPEIPSGSPDGAYPSFLARLRVVRGGSYASALGDTRSAARNHRTETYRDVLIGFRPARSLDPIR